MGEKPTYNALEVAEKTGWSKRLILKMLKENSIRHIHRPGNKTHCNVRISHDELVRLIKVSEN